MRPNYLFMFLGYPGSGKTYFSERLAKETGAVRINADALRVRLFGTIEAAKAFDAQTGLLNKITFNALDYAMTQVLVSGNSVICDYQHNARAMRTARAKVATDNDAVPIVVWVQTPRDEAVRRGSERPATLNHRRHSAEKMEALVARTILQLEEPDPSEKVIIIDGRLPFTDQYASFQRQLEALVRTGRN
ncbi:ATP-binding protein [Streptomyces caniscabiei]|uniref:AAA family ATPase n=1 Tax=Streptomyces caniscabiei TaxID=2746961 RepID=UPI0029A661E6|nr:ATP-binding protein [Streptomyces caniscabiei]MDX2776437.1 ATP-binding protein [Streptomyces caniscabiei]